MHKTVLFLSMKNMTVLVIQKKDTKTRKGHENKQNTTLLTIFLSPNMVIVKQRNTLNKLVFADLCLLVPA